ncbi:putative P-loop containing nucleoside triphosphate hydrolase [Helianthus annuus]|nr:putative P-loop containing nucleoside triphosphate hydrolase [Helianthus annuus]
MILVSKIVNFCKGLPLDLTIVGASLCGQPAFKWKTTLKKWSETGSILQSNSNILHSPKSSIDALDELPNVKECFLDLGSFPEDERISAIVLMDMWVVLYNLDDEGTSTSENLLELSLRNLINLSSVRKNAGEVDGYCNELYVTQHDLLRELAIHLSTQEPVAERKRFFIDVHRNEFPTWWLAQTEQPINGRILSISTDERISAIVLMDMWVVLYNLDDEGTSTSENLLELSLRNLINLSSVRKNAGEVDGYCNELYVTQHDLLRELAIHLSTQEPVAERKRFFIDVHRNEFPTWWLAQTEQPINGRILSISTGFISFYSFL